MGTLSEVAFRQDGWMSSFIPVHGVKDDMRINGVSIEMTSDRKEKRMEEENMLCRPHLVG
jgi:hypothetical protein